MRSPHTNMQVATQSQRLIQEFLERQAEQSPGQNADPLNIGDAFLELTKQMMAQPDKLVEAQLNLWRDYMGLWQHAADRMQTIDKATAAFAG